MENSQDKLLDRERQGLFPTHRGLLLCCREPEDLRRPVSQIHCSLLFSNVKE